MTNETTGQKLVLDPTKLSVAPTKKIPPSGYGFVKIPEPLAGPIAEPQQASKLRDDARDALGKQVREVWRKWARTQPNPKESWLVPYEELSETDKEADRMIGEALFFEGVKATLLRGMLANPETITRVRKKGTCQTVEPCTPSDA